MATTIREVGQLTQADGRRGKWRESHCWGQETQTDLETVLPLTGDALRCGEHLLCATLVWGARRRKVLSLGLCAYIPRSPGKGFSIHLLLLPVFADAETSQAPQVHLALLGNT